MPEYRAIYNDVYEREVNYRQAQFSPGFLNCVRWGDSLRWLRGRALDFGCGAGFVIEYLSQRPFSLECWGVDVSDRAVESARQRLVQVRGPDAASRVQNLSSASLPFADGYFNLVTCFDVLEHLDEPDIAAAMSEMRRVLRRGGLWFGSVSCRRSGTCDMHGENLHRTVREVGWWLAQVDPDRAEWEAGQSQLTMWKRWRKSVRR